MDSSWSQLRVATFQHVLGLPCHVISIAFAWKAWASKHLTQMPKQFDWLVLIHRSSFSTISPSHMTKRVTLALRVSPAPSGGSWFLLLTSAKFFFSSLHTQVWMSLSMMPCHFTVMEGFAYLSDRRSYVVLYLLSGVSEEHVLSESEFYPQGEINKQQSSIDLCLPPP